MKSPADKDPEDRAFEALFASQVRGDHAEEDPKALPSLSPEEKAAFAELGEDFISRLLAGKVKPRSPKRQAARGAESQKYE